MTTTLAPPGVAAPADSRSTHLTIRITRGSGTGPTSLAAFDAALRCAGVGDFNLIRLSSVIPPGALVRDTPAAEQVRGVHGDLLYCVYAEAHASTPGEDAWAGLGWARRAGGAGLLVEHHASSRTVLEHLLSASVTSLMAGREPGYRYAGRALSTVTCADEPACALVMATFRVQGWDWPR